MSRGTSRRELLFGRLRRALSESSPRARAGGVSRDIALYEPERRAPLPTKPNPVEAPPPWLINDPSQS